MEKSQSRSPREEAISLGYLREFKPCPERDSFSAPTRDMQVMVERMHLILDGLHEGEIPGEKLTAKELEGLCGSLVEGQRKDLTGFEDSWSVLPLEFSLGVPGDARVDFVYKPTYLVISVLTKVMTDHTELSGRIPGYEESLKRGYRFSTLRRLRGHGFGAEGDRIENIRIFEKGGVLKFISENPEFSPEMTRLLQEIRTEENITSLSEF